MAQAILNKRDVRFVTDNRGRKKGVLLNYKKFQQIIEMLEAQVYFENPEVQERLKKSEEDIRADRYLKVKAGNVDNALKWLNE